MTFDIVDEGFPIGKPEVLRAAEIAQHPALLSARDALHIAVMERHAIHSVLTFDRDFDRWPGIQRIQRV
jgi:predicted nucleic acid-binding protein